MEFSNANNCFAVTGENYIWSAWDHEHLHCCTGWLHLLGKIPPARISGIVEPYICLGSVLYSLLHSFVHRQSIGLLLVENNMVLLWKFPYKLRFRAFCTSRTVSQPESSSGSHLVILFSVMTRSSVLAFFICPSVSLSVPCCLTPVCLTVRPFVMSYGFRVPVI